jgi:hypothetical protein
MAQVRSSYWRLDAVDVVLAHHDLTTPDGRALAAHCACPLLRGADDWLVLYVSARCHLDPHRLIARLEAEAN